MEKQRLIATLLHGYDDEDQKTASSSTTMTIVAAPLRLKRGIDKRKQAISPPTRLFLLTTMGWNKRNKTTLVTG
jgi:hypothetical protein